MKDSKKCKYLSKDERRKVHDEIIRYFEVEKDEEIGLIQAENFTDFFVEEVLDKIYNKGIADSEKLLGERFQDFQVDLDGLKA